MRNSLRASMSLLVLLSPGLGFASPNPASEFCRQLGGLSEIRSDSMESASAGLGNHGHCRLSGGARGSGLIEEWTLMRAVSDQRPQEAVSTFFNHPEASRLPVHGGANPASIYCHRVGGASVSVYDVHGQSAMCLFPDGSQIEEWTLFRGPNDPSNQALVSALRSKKRYQPRGAQGSPTGWNGTRHTPGSSSGR